MISVCCSCRWTLVLIFAMNTSASAQASVRVLKLSAEAAAQTLGPPAEEFSDVVGGRILDRGNFLIADRGKYRLHIFDGRGVHIKDVGRTGSGPGELESIGELMRCGDTIAVVDGGQASLFRLDGGFVRRFRFAAHPTGTPPRRSTCNSRNQYLHIGWSSPRDARPGRFRGTVPVWITSSLPRVEKLVGQFPGDEGVLLLVDGKPRGVRPQPLGFDLKAALGTTSVWTLDTERQVVVRRTPTGDSAEAIRLPFVRSTPSSADIEAAMEDEGNGSISASIRTAYSTFDFSKPLPSADQLFLDDREQLWVRANSRAGKNGQSWFVYGSSAQSRWSLSIPSSWSLLDVRGSSALIKVERSDGTDEVRLYKILGLR